MLTEAHLAIWRRMTKDQRQRVIDATWHQSVGPHGTTWAAFDEAMWDDCCPLGVSLPALDAHHPESFMVEGALSEDVDLEALDRQAGGDTAAFGMLYAALLGQIRREAEAFSAAWDRGRITPDELITALRAMQAA